jgi:hypothetical protein
LHAFSAADFLVFWVGGGCTVRAMYFRSLKSPVYSTGLFPEPAGDLNRINTGLLPPRALVAGAMRRAVMAATEWNCEFIADLAAERAGLSKSEVVGIRWLAAAEEARLLHNIAKVLAAAIAPRRRDCEDAFVDALRLILLGAFAGSKHLRPRNQR